MSRIMIANADRDGGVGDVERPEMVRAPVDVDEVPRPTRRPRGRAGCRRAPADDQREPETRDQLVVRELAAYKPTPMSAAVAMMAITTVLNGKSTPFRNPNAVAVVQDVCESMKPGISVMLSCSRRFARTTPWSPDHGDDDHRQPDFQVAARRRRRVAFAGRNRIVECVTH